MTYPTINDLDLNLPNAVQGVVESPMIMRVGTVSAIDEAGSITVKISGSPVLVTASYLFPQYQPVLGDRVVTTRQDAQWFVLGTMSGPINSAIDNATFEDGVTGSVPTGWSTATVSGAGGTVTFAKQPGNYLGQPISGLSVGDVQFMSNGAAAFSELNVFSPSTPASPGQGWVPAFWVAGGVMSGTTLVLTSVFVQWLDGSGSVVAESAAQSFGYSSGGVVTPAFLRPQVGTTSFTAPVGTVFARLRINTQWAMTVPSAGTISDLFLDYVILRQVS